MISSLRLVKSYLCTTMKQERLNHLLLLHIHKDRQIDLLAAMREFVLIKSDYEFLVDFDFLAEILWV